MKTSGVITRAVSFALSCFLATTPTRATHLNGDMGGGVYVNIGQALMISHLSEEFGVCHGAQAAGVQATSFGDVLGSARFLLLEKSYVNCAGCKQAAPWWAAFASRIPSWCVETTAINSRWIVFVPVTQFLHVHKLWSIHSVKPISCVDVPK